MLFFFLKTILGLAITGAVMLFVLSYFFYGLPHRCTVHGWQGGDVCFDCEDAFDAAEAMRDRDLWRKRCH